MAKFNKQKRKRNQKKPDKSFAFETSGIKYEQRQAWLFVFLAAILVLLGLSKQESRVGLSTTETHPAERLIEPVPPTAEKRAFKTLLFLAAFATDRPQREAILGCIQERYEKECNLFGEKRARLLLVWELIKTYSSGIGTFAGKTIRTVFKYLGLGGIVRYFLS